MKSFKAYLTESTRTYDFKVRIAGDLATEDITKIKNPMATKIKLVAPPGIIAAML